MSEQPRRTMGRCVIGYARARRPVQETPVVAVPQIPVVAVPQIPVISGEISKKEFALTVAKTKKGKWNAVLVRVLYAVLGASSTGAAWALVNYLNL